MTDPIPAVEALREAARRVIEVVDEPSPQDDGTPEVEVGWYLRWEARHREAVDALRAALARQATPASGELDVERAALDIVAACVLDGDIDGASAELERVLAVRFGLDPTRASLKDQYAALARLTSEATS